MMRHLTQRRVVLISLTALLALLAVYLGWRLNYLLRHLDQVMTVQLQRQLGRAVHVDRVKVSPSGRVTISGLKVGSTENLKQGVLFEAERAVVYTSPWRLLWNPRDVVGGIDRVEVYSPALHLVRDEKGRWNTAGAHPRVPGARAFQFGGLVRLHDGVVTLVDYFPRGPRNPIRNRFVAIHGTLDGRPAQGYAISVSGRSALPQVAEASIEGTFDPQAVVADLALRATRADVAFWSNYLGLLKPFQPVAGRADLDLRLSAVQGHFEPSWITGTLRATGVVLSSRYLSRPVRQGRVTLTFRGRDIAVAGSATLNGVPATARGTVLAEMPPRLNLTLTSNRANLARLADALRGVDLDPRLGLPTTGRLTARITGTPQSPVVTARADLGPSRVDRTAVENLSLAGSYRDGIIQVRSASGRALGGTVRLMGQVRLPQRPRGAGAAPRLGPLEVRAEGSFAGIRLGQVPVGAAEGLSGVASGTFRVSGTLQRLVGQATVSAQNVVRATARARSLQARVQVARRGGVWAGRGTFGAQGLARGPGRAGSATGAFQFAGPPDRLAPRATFTARNLVYGQAQVAAVGGSARSPDGRTWSLDLSLTRGRTPLARFATGSARLTASLGGPISGTVVLIQGQARGVAFQRLVATGTLRDQVLSLERATAAAAGGTLTASGRVSLRGPLSLQVSGQGVELSPLAKALGYEDLSGTASFDGRAAGTLSSPVLTGDVTIRDGVVRNVAFDRLTAQLVASPERISLRDADLRRGDGRLLASGDILLRQGRPVSASLTAQVSGLPVQDLLDLAQREERLPGALEGQIHVTGPVGSLQLSGNLVLRNTEVRGVPLQEVSVGLRQARGVTEIESLRAVGQDFTITGSGELQRNNRVVLNLEGSSIPLARLSAALEPYATVTGTASFTATVVGPIARPSVTAHVDAQTLTINGQPFSNLTTDVSVLGQRLQVSDLALQWDGSALRVPEANFQPDPARLEAVGTLEQAGLATLTAALFASDYLKTKPAQDLAALIARVPRPVAGTASGSFRVAGPLAGPQLATSLTVADLSLGGTPIGDLVADGSWSPEDGLALNPLRITNPQVTLVAEGAVHPEEASQLRVEVPRGSVQGLLSLLERFRFLAGQAAVVDRVFAAVERLPRPIGGGIQAASLVLTGGAPQTTGVLNFDLQNVQVAGQQVDDVQGTMDLRGTTLLIRRLHAEGRDMDLAISGSAESEGALNLVVDANFVALPLLIPWLDLPKSLQGTANGHLEVRGTVEAPDITGYFTARDVSVRGVTLQSVRVLDIHVSQDQLVLGSITLVTPQGYTATASGSLPLREGALGVAQDRPIRFHAELEQQNLGILTALSPEVKSADGTIQGALDITGTLGDPQFDGTLSLTNGSIDFAHLESDLSNLTLLLSLRGREAQVAQLSGSSTAGGSFQGSGTISFPTFTNPTPNLSLTLDSLQIADNNITQRFGERLTALLNGQLVVRPGPQRPVLTGEVVVANANLSLPPSFPPNGKMGVPLLPNARLDVRVTLAQNNQVERGGARLRGQGELALGGTLYTPVVTGTVSHITGTVNFYNLQRFTVLPDSSVQIRYNADPQEVSVAYLDVRARTMIRAPSVTTLERQRYRVTVSIEGPMELSPPRQQERWPFIVARGPALAPTISFESDPPGLDDDQIIAALSRQVEIQALLAGRDLRSVFRDQLAEAFTGAIAPQFLEPLESAIAQALGLEEFALVLDLETPAQVQLTKQIVGPFYLTYRRSFTGARTDFLFRISYRFTPRYQLSWSTDERGLSLWSIEAHQRFGPLFAPRLRAGAEPSVVQVPSRDGGNKPTRD